MSPLVSVVIPTYNRAEYLRKALNSLFDQEMPREAYDITVVDNCSTDATKAVVEGYRGRVKYLREMNLGANHARNAGWRHATGRYIAFLDDDAIADKRWLCTLADALETVPQPGCIGGKVDPIWLAPRPPWLANPLLHALAIIDWGPSPRALMNIAQSWLVSANLAFPTEVLHTLGGFSTQFGRVGNNLLSNDETLLQRQILEKGLTVLYHPGMLIQHHILPSRLTQDWFRRRYYWQGVSDAVVQLVHEKPSPRLRLFDAVRGAADLLRSPDELRCLIMPSDDPEAFRRKCFSLIKVGHIAGLLGAAGR